MGLFSKITRKINFDKKISYEPSFKQKIEKKESLFEDVFKNKHATSLEVDEAKDAIKISIEVDKERIVYRFKKDKDGLLLLRGAFANGRMMISDGSIPDFAILARPAGSGSKFDWVPSHNRKKGVSKNVDLKVTITDDAFKIEQTFVAFNFNCPDTPLWNHKITHQITLEKPYMEINNSLNFINDTDVKKSFFTMLPSNSKIAKSLFLSNGIYFNEIPNDGKQISMDGIYNGAMYESDYIKGKKYVSIVGINELKERPSIVTFRKDRVTKFYLNEFSGIAKKETVINYTNYLGCLVTN